MMEVRLRGRHIAGIVVILFLWAWWVMHSVMKGTV